MTTQEKKSEIKKLVEEMLTESHETMMKKIDKILSSGCVDIGGWDRADAPMILPKCIVTALLQNESTQYEGKGTSFESRVKKEVRNIRYFL